MIASHAGVPRGEEQRYAADPGLLELHVAALCVGLAHGVLILAVGGRDDQRRIGRVRQGGHELQEGLVLRVVGGAASERPELGRDVAAHGHGVLNVELGLHPWEARMPVAHLPRNLASPALPVVQQEELLQIHVGVVLLQETRDSLLVDRGDPLHISDAVQLAQRRRSVHQRFHGAAEVRPERWPCVPLAAPAQRLIERHDKVHRGAEDLRQAAAWAAHGRTPVLVPEPQEAVTEDVLSRGDWHLRDHEVAVRRPPHRRGAEPLQHVLHDSELPLAGRRQGVHLLEREVLTIAEAVGV
mmetsp:Transcript_125251/g.389921  ORF Transcript_125251/g.389921 Transcript_125251/m.389921 type:complete len:298 (+) Transcript_125251:615-1508(+)